MSKACSASVTLSHLFTPQVPVCKAHSSRNKWRALAEREAAEMPVMKTQQWKCSELIFIFSGFHWNHYYYYHQTFDLIFKSDYKTENNGDILWPSPRWASKVKSCVFSSWSYRWDADTHVASKVQNGTLERIQVSLNSRGEREKKNFRCCCPGQSVNKSIKELQCLPWELQMLHHLCILNKLSGSLPVLWFQFQKRRHFFPTIWQYLGRIGFAQEFHNSLSPASLQRWWKVYGEVTVHPRWQELQSVHSQDTEKVVKDEMPCMENWN